MQRAHLAAVLVGHHLQKHWLADQGFEADMRIQTQRVDLQAVAHDTGYGFLAAGTFHGAQFLG